MAAEGETAQVWSRTTGWARPANVAAAAANAQVFADPALPSIVGLVPYDLRNGAVADITPFMERATIPAWSRWVPLVGATATNSMRAMYGYVASAQYQISHNNTENWDAARVRTTAIMLGVTRATIQAMFNPSPNDFLAGEVATPVLELVVQGDNYSYRSLVPAAAGAAGEVTETSAAGAAAQPNPFGDVHAFSEEEQRLLPALVRSAQAIVPIQGYNLISEGHHYLSERTKMGYKAFAAVEKQVWVGAGAALKEDVNHSRTVIWHKAGHPVSIQIKLAAATDPDMAPRLAAAGIGSAAPRLPALESDIRGITAYIKVCRDVRATYEEAGGGVDARVLEAALSAVHHFAYGRQATPHQVTTTLTLNSRLEAVRFAKAAMEVNSAVVATLFGFYSGMVEDTATGAADADTTVRAFSLRKLKGENMSNFLVGQQQYLTYKASMAKARAAGEFKPPTLRLTVPNRF